jgi:DNA invertase Pin-like site-specific DNA recombinase
MARKSRKNVETTLATSVPERILYNAAAYVRLSSDDTKKRGDSLETQRSIIENYIAAMPDIRLYHTYTDNNATGTNFDRPGFQKMLADAESGKINCIIVKDLSRFGRNAIDAGYYLEKHLPALGVRFIAVTDSFDSSESDGGILLPLKNIISEAYALDISRKCKAVQQQNIREGRFVGRMAPYGYLKDPHDCHKLIIDENAAPMIRQIFEWAYQGIGVNELVRRLNDAGILPPSHYKQSLGMIANEKLIGTQYWKKRTINKILSNRVYAGDMIQGKKIKINHKELFVDPDQWICVENTHEPIISRNVFNEVQRIKQRNYALDAAKRQSIGSYSDNLFKGKVFCAKCGYAMNRKRQNKDGIYWYRCESQWKYASNACVQVSIKEIDLKTEILTTLHKHAEAILGKYIYLEQSAAALNKTTISIDLREIHQELDKCGRMLKSLYESMVSQLITPDEYTQMKTDYEAKIESLAKCADEIRNTHREAETRAAEYRDLAEAVSTAISDDRLTADIIGRLVDKILIHPDKSFEIYFRFGDEFREVCRNA